MIAIPGRTVALSSLLALATCLQPAMAQDDNGGNKEVQHKTKDPHDTASPTAGSTGSQTPLITYHNGPVMAMPNVYLIWYGNWNQSNGSDNAQGQQIVRDFLYGLSGSPYYTINSSYPGVSGKISVAGEYTDTGSQGTRLSDSRVQAVVSSAIASGRLGGPDTNGLYFVLTSSNVSESSGFCTQYCGWHTAGTISGSNIKYSFVGNANRCLSACAAQTTSPNGNAGVDGMISVIAHELEETNTDPNPRSGWADSNGAENGDKCAWTFGSHQTLLNGAYYNMTLPTKSGPPRNYLVQRNLASDSKCYIDYVTKAQ